MNTTLAKIREFNPNSKMWIKLLTSLNKTKRDNEPLNILKIIEVLGMHDAVWCMQTVEGYEKELSQFSLFCLKQTEHLVCDEIKNALKIAENYTNGNFKKEKFDSFFQKIIKEIEESSKILNRGVRTNEELNFHIERNKKFMSGTGEALLYFVKNNSNLSSYFSYKNAKKVIENNARKEARETFSYEMPISNDKFKAKSQILNFLISSQPLPGLSEHFEKIQKEEIEKMESEQKEFLIKLCNQQSK